MPAPIGSYAQLEDFGRTRLSRNFFMREFLHSEIAAWHGMRNVPDDPEQAIWAGRQLCTQLLEPLQASFGRIHVRSGYRSPEVNAFGNQHKLNCASNEKNYGRHIWDRPDANGHRGATACIVVPWLLDHIEQGGSWTGMAWWIHDHLPYSGLYFFPRLFAFNIHWSEAPVRRVDSYAQPKGCLIQPGTPASPGLHARHYPGFPAPGCVTKIVHAMPRPVMPVPAPSPALRVVSPAERPSTATTAKVSPAMNNPSALAGAQARSASSSGKICYRAIHAKTKWRKAGGHKDLESAIRGPNGAAALFRGKVRIDYATHGQPLFALVWQEGASTGSLIRADASQPDGIRIASLPMARLQEFEDRGGASELELARFFDGAS